MAAAMTPYAAAQGAAAPGGYTGLQGILSALSGGVNASQLANMTAGNNGADGGAIGGMHGAFAGLSPYAVHFLATSGLLDAKPAATVPLTDASGAPLTGTALLMANLQNTLNAGQPAQYQLASGINASDLAQLFAGGIDGHSAYAHGYDANGQAGGGAPHLPTDTYGGGRPTSLGPNPIYGYGLAGHPFHSLAAYHASLAYRQAQRSKPVGTPVQAHPGAGGGLPTNSHGGGILRNPGKPAKR